jgi:hypothetical protein
LEGSEVNEEIRKNLAVVKKQYEKVNRGYVLSHREVQTGLASIIAIEASLAQASPSDFWREAIKKADFYGAEFCIWCNAGAEHDPDCAYLLAQDASFEPVSVNEELLEACKAALPWIASTRGRMEALKEIAHPKAIENCQADLDKIQQAIARASRQQEAGKEKA